MSTGGTCRAWLTPQALPCCVISPLVVVHIQRMFVCTRLQGEIEKLKARDAAAGNYGRGTKRRLLVVAEPLPAMETARPVPAAMTV